MKFVAGIERLMVGPLQSNCYIVWDENSLEAMVVDPGAEPLKIMRKIKERGLKVSHVVCTHGHFDHIGALSVIKAETGAKIAVGGEDVPLYMHARDQAAAWGFSVEQPPAPDLLLKEGQDLTIGGLIFKILETPGHSPGGICLYNLQQAILFTGDTVFAGSVGRTDFLGGDSEKLKESFARIISLPPDVRVLPGHGDESTIGEEIKSNFFVHEL